jgi:hypothetical protein
MTTIDQVLEAAKEVVEAYSLGYKHRDALENSIVYLAARLKAYESQQETVRIENAQRKD